jgi:predicted lipid carrier protein YhbT
MLEHTIRPLSAARAQLANLPPMPKPLAKRVASINALALRPVEHVLTASLRRLARQRPAVFERLGQARHASILLDPVDWPVCFVIHPDGLRGRVKIVQARDESCDAFIEAPIGVLLNLMEGREDGDAAFFSSDLWIEGDTTIVLSLRNAIEEAEMQIADLVPLPKSLVSLLERLISDRTAMKS